MVTPLEAPQDVWLELDPEQFEPEYIDLYGYEVCRRRGGWFEFRFPGQMSVWSKGITSWEDCDIWVPMKEET